MSLLTIRLDSNLADANLEKAALAAVYSISEKGLPAKVTELFLPLGEAIPPSSIDLAPGQYLVEAGLPSGERLTATVQLPETREARLHMPEDQVRRLLGRPAEQCRPRSTAGGSMLSKSTARFAPGNVKGPHAWIWRQPGVGANDHTRVRDSLRSLAGMLQSGSVPSGMELHPITPKYEDDALLHFDLDSGDIGSADRHDRAFLLMEHDGQRWLLALPLPWFSRGQSVPLRIAMTRQAKTSSAGLSVGLEDPDLSVPLGYLAEGAARTAGRLLDLYKVEEMLMEKMANPLGAALGGYILLQTGGQLGMKGLQERQIWHSWLDNLHNWFPWLPDGAIQNGWLKLQRQSNEQDIEKARASLLEACRRGLPYYTRGLTMLMEGLRLFEQDGDKDAADWLKILQPIAWRADMSQVFLCLRFSAAGKGEK